MNSNLDLWPSGIEVERVSAPLTILRQQAALLGERTKNLVQAEVIEDELQTNRFVFFFFLLAPVLGNYRYQLIRISHDIGLYPIEIKVEPSILQEVQSTLDVRTEEVEGDIARFGKESYYIHVASEEELIKALRAIFNSNKCRKVLTALLSQSDPTWTGVAAMTNGTAKHNKATVHA
ncbi:MAG: hypothetical protein DYG89_14855 [Caldilinea sp. CFX5]|nr:hypothetical protein [Caldilinea sp. CFX5]